MKIKDSVVIVTGASSGIGLETARLLSEQGAHVVLAARSKEKLEQLAGEMPNSVAIPTDMRKLNDITKLVTQTESLFGRVDILVNNAGQGLRAPIEAISLDAYRDIMELNVFSVLEAMQAVIPIMRTQGGGDDSERQFAGL
jgi:NADP-dependent 3-hydroxy acid dehydrogenase YdfG